jgi:tetratricopeptide (TPR) repeat protein
VPEILCPHCDNKLKYAKENQKYGGFETYICKGGKFSHIFVHFDNDLYNELYQAVVKSTTTLWKTPISPVFTDHSQWHSARVLENIEKILLPLKDNKSFSLEPEEFLLLILSAYLHDTAMQNPSDEITKKLGTNSITESEFREILRKCHSQKAPDTCAKILGDITTGNPLLTSIVGGLAEPLNLLTEFHSGNEETLRKINFEDISNSIIKISGKKLIMFAAVLRLADELDLDRKRVEDFNIHKGKHLPPRSSLHWLKHLIIEQINIENQEISINFRRPPCSKDRQFFYQKLGIWIKSKIESEINLLCSQDRMDCIHPGCGGMINLRLSQQVVLEEHFKEDPYFPFPEHLKDNKVWNQLEMELKDEIDNSLKAMDENQQEKITKKIYGDEKEKAEEYREEIGRALLLYARGDSINAVEILKPINEEIDDITIAKILAEIEYKEGYYENTVVLLEKVLEKEPENIEVLFNKGVAHSGLKQKEEAKKCYEKILEINPDYSNALNNLGIIYSEENQKTEALQYFEKSLNIDPNDYKALYNIGKVYEESGENELAIEYYGKAIKIKPDFTDAFCSLGFIYEKIGQFAEAIKQCEKALKFRKNVPDILYNLGVLHLNNRCFEQSLRYLKDSLKIKPKNHRVLNLAGILYSENNQHNRAIQFFNTSLKIEPEFNEAFNNIQTAKAKKAEYDLQVRNEGNEESIEDERLKKLLDDEFDEIMSIVTKGITKDKKIAPSLSKKKIIKNKKQSIKKSRKKNRRKKK